MLLVTGGSGHLGANLVRRLLEDGEKVRALCREGSDNRALDGLPIERFPGDLRDPAAMREAVRGCERVYHAAAKIATVGGSHREIYDCNVIGTKNLLRAAREEGVKRVVVTSSFSAVGHLRDRPSDEEVPFYPFERVLPYEQTKVLVELETLRALADGLDVVIATSCAILGPHDYKPSRMGRTLLDFARGRMPAWIPGGFQFVSARDLAEGHVLAMQRGRSGQKYILGTEFVTVDDLMDLFQKVTGHRKPPLRLPPKLMFAIAQVTSPILTRFFPQVPQRLTPDAVRLLGLGRRADVSKARRELGYRPTSIRQAVESAFDDFVERGLLPPNPARIPRIVTVPSPTPSPSPDRGRHAAPN